MQIKNFSIPIIIIISLLFLNCSESNQQLSPGKRLFGKLNNGKEVYMYTLKNKNGMSAEIMNYGATVVSLFAPDKNGKLADVILGYDSLKRYERGFMINFQAKIWN